ncbi:MAG: hypothetical protein KAG61_04635, partial [Bacteriovoracaceae bacterium]|nr:hypothetical protein [Bacteriovoracaceae bacterium]
MKKIVALIFILTYSLSFAGGHSGSGSMNYDPSEFSKQGFEIKIDYQWALSSLMQEPLKGIQVAWSFVDNNSAVAVSFREVQTGKLIETSAPREIVEQCRPISIELTGKVKDTRGVTLTIDGGVFAKNGESFNIQGSPAWNKLFNDLNRFMPAEKAKELYRDKNFELSFTERRAKVKFDLTPLKEWFAMKQLDKRAKAYCEELDRTYSNLKKISSKFPYNTKKSKLDRYCKYPAAEIIGRLK